MYRSAYDLKAFYNTKVGRVVRRLLQERIREFWPDARGMRVMGCGYATPFLRSFMDESERVFALMPAAQGAHDWPHDSRNLVAVSDETDLPIESNSVDRVILVHGIEFSGQQINPAMAEIWRVLKSSGRLLMIVPNRSGLWAHADWSPFGQGTPYSSAQIHHYLRENMFVHERTEEALFVPPVKFSLILKSARVFERTGRIICPVLGGVHMVEASKQLYAHADHRGTRVRVGAGVRALMPKTLPQGFKP